MIVRALGYEDVKRCIPFSIERIKQAYESGDKSLNKLSIRKWDLAAGFNTGRIGQRCDFVGSELTRLYWKKLKVDTFSCSDGVCCLKECAIMWAEEEK